MSNISIHTEFLPGTDIYKAVVEAKGLAKKLDVAYIIFDFNGVSVSVSPDAVIPDEVHLPRNPDQKFMIFAANGRLIQ